MKRGKLLLLPNLLADVPHHEMFLPASVDRAVESLDGLIAESEKGGRRFLSRFRTEKPAHQIPIALLNKHHRDIDFLLEPLLEGETWGVVSDAGLPCLADPGSHLVARARKLGLKVQAFVGPSSITLALMLSGFPGQSFHFHGYLPKDPTMRDRKIMEMEKEGGTQIFIEAPHRNQSTLESLLHLLKDTTKLCAAWQLTTPEQGIVSECVSVWKKSPLPKLQKQPAIFLIGHCV